ncbi:MAG: D-aminoacylase [bacterium]|nr:D-aminoacylase [bacterium]
MYDLIIKDGIIVDGTGKPKYVSDIGINEERITNISDLSDGASKKVIDARDCVVSPGFIDIHSHSDFTILVNPTSDSKVKQGVTTEVIGNCGFSAAPSLGKIKEKAGNICKGYGLEFNWSSLGEYLNQIRDISVNVVPLVGQGNIRAAVLGYEDRKPTYKEQDRMKYLLKEAFEQGSFGLSAGLIYPPGCFTKGEELIELCKVVVEFEGVFASHIRSEGTHLIEAIEEVIDIGKETGVKVHISHLKTQGKESWKRLDTVFKKIEDGLRDGIRITCDRYPYLAGSTDLDIILPSWVYEGGTAEELKRLRDPECRERLKGKILESHGDSWEDVMISSVSRRRNKWMEGKRISQILKEINLHPCDFIFDLLIDEKAQVQAIFFSMSEDNLKRILKKPYTSIGSDSSSRKTSGILAKGKPHPRAFGTFPHVLSKYVREEKILTMEEAIHKMTGANSLLIGIKERGFIKEGMYADIVVFNPRLIKDQATYEDPFKYPKGIEYVLVNGKITVKRGRHTGVLAGKVLKRDNI